MVFKQKQRINTATFKGTIIYNVAIAWECNDESLHQG
jgi:hypothetical protein